MPDNIATSLDSGWASSHISPSLGICLVVQGGVPTTAETVNR